jgi:hypothetical protein
VQNGIFCRLAPYGECAANFSSPELQRLVTKVSERSAGPPAGLGQFNPLAGYSRAKHALAERCRFLPDANFVILLAAAEAFASSASSD